jgi:putative hydrolase of the HAD superfamily
MIRLLIFDLDNTLYSARTIPPSVLEPAFTAVRRANAGAAACDADALERALAACWREPFDVVARRYALPPALYAAWAAEGARLEVTGPLEPYPDVSALARLPLPRLLVTTGYERFQRSKVAALGIGGLFDRILIDALDAPRRPGKEGLFRAILAEWGVAAAEALVVGDSGDSEIAAGGRIGMPTVQVVRPGVVPTDAARFHIASLEELPQVLSQLEA